MSPPDNRHIIPFGLPIDAPSVANNHGVLSAAFDAALNSRYKTDRPISRTRSASAIPYAEAAQMAQSAQFGHLKLGAIRSADQYGMTDAT